MTLVVSLKSIVMRNAFRQAALCRFIKQYTTYAESIPRYGSKLPLIFLRKSWVEKTFIEKSFLIVHVMRCTFCASYYISFFCHCTNKSPPIISTQLTR